MRAAKSHAVKNLRVLSDHQISVDNVNVPPVVVRETADVHLGTQFQANGPPVKIRYSLERWAGIARRCPCSHRGWGTVSLAS